MQEEKSQVLITADGPKGPARRVKEGAVQLAAKTGSLGHSHQLGATRVKVLEKSWDRFLVPLPFGRIRFAYGPPLRIEPGLDAGRPWSEPWTTFPPGSIYCSGKSSSPATRCK